MLFWRKKSVISIEHDGQFNDDGVFCAMPFVHFHVAQNGNVTPCCQAPWGDDAKLGNINQQSIQEIWTGKPFETFRKQMLKGKAPEVCNRCYDKEKMGWISLREITNDKYQDEISEFIRQKFHASTYSQPVYFDIRFSNVCNLKCRICNFSSSSSWHNDDVSLGNIDPKTPAISTSILDEDKFYGEFKHQIGTIKEIYFAGGEPLMMEQHYQILAFLIESGNTKCKLFYNTNLSRLNFKNHDVLDYWKQFDYVNLAVSLDDIGERLEYQRKNIKWDQIKLNFDRIKQETKNVDVMISPTISVFNLLSISEMHQTLVAENHVRPEDVVPTLLVYPQEFNIQILPAELKEMARNRIENHLEWLSAQIVSDDKKMKYVHRQYLNILTYLNHTGSEKARLNFPSKIQQLDALREEKFELVFPELAGLLESNPR
jgi:radical SAM protein with 4Fe4S-binding SPASM domain